MFWLLAFIGCFFIFSCASPTPATQTPPPTEITDTSQEEASSEEEPTLVEQVDPDPLDIADTEPVDLEPPVAVIEEPLSGVEEESPAVTLPVSPLVAVVEPEPEPPSEPEPTTSPQRSVSVMTLTPDTSTQVASAPTPPPAATTAPTTTVVHPPIARPQTIERSPAETNAIELYYQGNIEGSIREFERLLQNDPNNVRIKWELIRAYGETGEGIHVTALLENLAQQVGMTAEIERELFINYVLTANFQKATALLPLSQQTSETLFYEAMLRRDIGERDRAIELFKRSLAMENHRPIAWFMLGELVAHSSPQEAETHFRTALNQDPEMRIALFPLGNTLLAQRNHREAYNYLSRAQSYFPQSDPIIRSLNEALRFLPRDPERPRERHRITAIPPSVTPVNVGNLTMVRIGIAEMQNLLTVKAGAAYTLRGDNRTEIYSGRAHDQLWIELRNNRIVIQDVDGRVVANADRPVTLEYAQPGNTTIVSIFDTEERAYRGSMEFRIERGGITVVNIVNIEEYLYGVVPAEMCTSWHQEALRPQAIAARSYTMAYMGHYMDRGFDLYGSVLSAAYRGVTGEANTTTAAVNTTRGIYLRAGGRPLRAYYSANHGGYSESSISVWGTNTFNVAVADRLTPTRTSLLSINELTQWIRERPRTYSSVENLHSPQAFRWEKWVSAEEIRSRIAYDGNIGDIVQVISRGRGVSGRINEIELRGTQGNMLVTGDRIRSRMGGLRSNLFNIRVKMGRNGRPEYFIFQGAGWGHGVGMDQSGAAGMAQAGFTYTQILQHYYPLAEIVRN